MAKTYQVRLSEKAYNLVRRAAFKKHVPMVDILEGLIVAAAIEGSMYKVAAKQD